MNVAHSIDLLRQAIYVTLLVAGPILLIGLLVALGISLVQAVTQLQEQTLSFVPRIMAMTVAIVLFLPWMVEKLVSYGRHMLGTLPR